MTYGTLMTQIKSALGLSSGDDARIIAELNVLLYDICFFTDWTHLRARNDTSTNMSGLVPGAVPAGPPVVPGVTCVRDEQGVFFYCGGMLPKHTGRRFWIWNYPVGSMVLYGADGEPLSATDVIIDYWQVEDELTSSNVATREIKFPSIAPFLSGLRGRWYRFQELRPEEAVPYEQVFVNELASAAARDRKGARPPAITIGGVVYSSADRSDIR